VYYDRESYRQRYEEKVEELRRDYQPRQPRQQPIRPVRYVRAVWARRPAQSPARAPVYRQ
jgi:hypothetical protein